MKLLQVFITLSLFILVSCEMPRQPKRRLGSDPNPLTDPFGDGNNNNNNNNGGDDGGGNDGGGTVNVDIPDAATHCNWSTDGINGFPFSHPTIGSYGLCRSQLDEGKVFFQS